MSLQTFIHTIETDIGAGVTWVEHETDAAMHAIWGVAAPIFVAFEPTIVQGLLARAVSLLTSLEKAVLGQMSLPDLETALLNEMGAEGHALLGDAQKIGSDILQALIGLARATHIGS